MQVSRLRLLSSFSAFLLLTLSAFAIPNSENTTELKRRWRMQSAWNVVQDGSLISQLAYDPSSWHAIHSMPVTVLQALQEDGTYPNLYFGQNLTEPVPRDIFRQDWWYRTVFMVPAEHKLHWLVFKGINYRAEIWLNGER